MTKFLGQDIETLKNQVIAIILNVYSWLLAFLPFQSGRRAAVTDPNRCISISGPGGLDVLQVIPISGSQDGVRATVGYNIPDQRSPFVSFSKGIDKLPADLVLVRNKYFSVNYADVCIRWGLYESALRYVGWPIVPGFDFAGIVEWAGPDSPFKVGDEVFGFTLFGAYSSRILVPESQLRKKPKKISMEDASALPAVAATALHALALAGAFPGPILSNNRAVLIHSAAGGVGSMLIQMCKLVGFSPIVAVVGSKHKVNFCTELGADYVIDKSSSDLWTEAEKISRDGYVAVFDANGVSTMNDSYEHLCRCGRLIVYGFHSNLPKVSDLLSPWAWVGMILKVFQMPKFDAMAMTLDSKGVLGFNLSFFADEKALIEQYMKQIIDWVDQGKLKVASVTVFPMEDINRAHELIQSGASVGKIVCKID